MKIVVTGSLGHISKPLALELVQKGHEVTVISSKAGKQKEIEHIGATAAIGSVEDVDFWRPRLPVPTLYIVWSLREDFSTQILTSWHIPGS